MATYGRPRMSQMSQVAHESPGTQRGQPDDAGLIAESCRAPERFGVVVDRHALLLVADGLSYAEAAQALGVPPGTLSSRVARARRKLRARLGGVNPADENQEQGHG